MRNSINQVLSALLGAALAMTVGTVTASEEISAATAETITACEDAARLLREKDIDGASEEAYWCFNGIKEMKDNLTLALFPDQVLDFTGGEIDNQEIMGMRMIEREYSTDDSDSIKVSLTGGGAASAGLAMLAGLGANLNLGASKKKIRVQKRAVMDMSEGNNVQYMVQLKSGSMLNFSSNDVDADTALEFVRAFPIAELDDAIGQ